MAAKSFHPTSVAQLAVSHLQSASLDLKCHSSKTSLLLEQENSDFSAFDRLKGKCHDMLNGYSNTLGLSFHLLTDHMPLLKAAW